GETRDLGGIREGLGRPPGRLARRLPSRGGHLPETIHRCGERLGVTGVDYGTIHAVFDQLAAAGLRARHDGESGSQRFEVDVAERLRPSGKHGHVSSAIPALHVGPWPQPDDPLGDSETRGVRLVRGPLTAANYDEPAVVVTERGERLHRRDQALALEA